ncbi:cell division protein FtsQ/DivIB [Haloimpatiens sp. FM7315]|uniref:cell division protein FtsQ/DivIB n=1 Tax=Haloimpatiens sp. FM7315 TaxID=3298609 RepID=UPI0035A35220
MVTGDKKDNITYLNESKYIIDNRKELIEKRKRKKYLIRIFFLSSVLLVIFLTLLFKLPYFSIKEVNVINNNNIKKEEIIRLSQIEKDTNIFKISLKNSSKKILTNPYVLEADVKRKLPNKIIIDVKERKAAFYVISDSKYYIVDKNSVVLEKKDNINSMKLIRCVGVDEGNFELGQVLPFNDKAKAEAIKEVTELFLSTSNNIQMSILDVSKTYDIKAYYGNMCVKIGDSTDLKNKFNKALSIMEIKNLNGKKGYIDVSFKGNPVFFIEN